MFAFEAGRTAVRNYRGLSARAAMAALLAVLGGCASDQHQSSTSYGRANITVAQTIDVEDDGLPAQSAPNKSVRYAPDDPSEPYSRNYGGVNPSATGVPAAAGPAPQRDPVPDVPDDLPPAFRQKLVTAMTSEE